YNPSQPIWNPAPLSLTSAARVSGSSPATGDLPSLDTEAPCHVHKEASLDNQILDGGPLVGPVGVSRQAGSRRIAQNAAVGNRAKITSEVGVGETDRGTGEQRDRLTKHSPR